MSNVKFNALASLALLAGAPVVAQAAMVEMAETELADVNGQGVVTGFISGALRLPDPFPIPLVTPISQAAGRAVTNPLIDDSTASAPGTIACVGTNCTFTLPTAGSTDSGFLPRVVGGAVGNAVTGGINFGLLPITAPTNALGAFNTRVGSNAAGIGSGIADIAFAPFQRGLNLATQGTNTALDFLFFPISAPLDIAGNVFGALDNGVVGTASRILTAPLNAVFGPVNRYVDGVTGRFEATVDGAAFAATEVKGALITNAFAGASQAAANNDLNFTARVFGRISQAQAGLTANRLADLSGKYGY